VWSYCTKAYLETSCDDVSTNQWFNRLKRKVMARSQKCRTIQHCNVTHSIIITLFWWTSRDHVSTNQWCSSIVGHTTTDTNESVGNICQGWNDMNSADRPGMSSTWLWSSCAKRSASWWSRCSCSILSCLQLHTSCYRTYQQLQLLRNLMNILYSWREKSKASVNGKHPFCHSPSTRNAQ